MTPASDAARGRESRDTGRASPAAPAKPSRRPPPVRESAPASAPSPAPTAKLGYLTINAVPYGTVSIDGVEVGDTPIVRHELSPGTHTVAISRDGFRTERAEVTITASNEVRLSRSLVGEGP